jgi:predicted TIM-barrel fold metal-dependent hydrolase
VDTVVDTDVHINDDPEEVFQYLDRPFDKLLNIDMTDHNGRMAVSNVYPSAGYLHTQIDTGKVQLDSLRSQADVHEGMEMLNVDRSLLMPGQNLRLGMVHHDELAAGIAQAYNDWVLDNYLDGNADLYGAITVAPQKPTLAAEEIEKRADESDFIGVYLPSGGVMPPLGHERYFPIYEAAENAGLPVLLHGAVTGVMSTAPPVWRGTKRLIDLHTTAFVIDQMIHLSTLVTNGVPVRYPGVDFVIQEAGIGWIPYFTHRIDDEYSEKSEDAPLLERPPSEYIRDRFYFSSQPLEGVDDPEYLKHMIRMFDGGGTLMYSSDFPHPDFDNSGKIFSALKRALDDDEVANIFGNNALEVLDF